MELNPDFQELIRSFVDHDVRFLIVGGSALAAADFEKPGVVVQLGREPQRIDILTFATGLVFDGASDHRVSVDVGGPGTCGNR